MYRAGSRVPLITPKFPDPRVVLGLLKWALLKKLKKLTSNLNCRLSAPRGVVLARAKSQLLRPGPRTCPTPELPKVLAAGNPKQLVSNHRLTVFGVETLLQVILAGLLPPPLPKKTFVVICT